MVVGGVFMDWFKGVCLISFMDFPLFLFIGVGWVEGGYFFVNIGGGSLEVLIGFTGFKATFGVGGGFGGVRYQIGRPNVKLKRLSVSIMRDITIIEGGNKNHI